MKNIFSALAALFLICVSAQGMAEEAEEDFSQLIYRTPPLGHFDFEQDPEFSMIVLELKNWLVHQRHDEEHGIDRLKRWNHFCAVGYVFPVDPDEKEEFPLEKEVVVYWKEERVFKRWHGSDPKLAKENFYFAWGLRSSFGYSLEGAVSRKDLDKTFLGTRQQIKEDAENLIADCEKHGNQYIIGPFTPPFEEH
jgi:hypothetical protein